MKFNYARYRRERGPSVARPIIPVLVRLSNVVRGVCPRKK
jgi:hypothetical protein